MNVTPLQNEFTVTLKLILEHFLRRLEDHSCRNIFINRPSCHTINLLPNLTACLYLQFYIATLQQRLISALQEGIRFQRLHSNPFVQQLFTCNSLVLGFTFLFLSSPLPLTRCLGCTRRTTKQKPFASAHRKVKLHVVRTSSISNYGDFYL